MEEICTRGRRKERGDKETREEGRREGGRESHHKDKRKWVKERERE